MGRAVPRDRATFTEARCAGVSVGVEAFGINSFDPPPGTLIASIRRFCAA